MKFLVRFLRLLCAIVFVSGYCRLPLAGFSTLHQVGTSHHLQYQTYVRPYFDCTPLSPVNQYTSQRTVDSLQSYILNYTFDRMTLELGVNDALLDTANATYANNMRIIIDSIFSHNPATKLVLVNAVPVENTGANAKLGEMNDSLAVIAAEYSDTSVVGVLDLNAWMYSTYGTPPWTDGVHFDDTVYQDIADTMVSFINATTSLYFDIDSCSFSYNKANVSRHGSEKSYQLILKGEEIAENDVNVPLLISGYKFPSSFWSTISSDASNFEVTASDTSTHVDYSVLALDTAAQKMNMAIKFPTVTAGTNTSVFLFVGTDSSVTNTPSNVWKNNYNADLSYSLVVTGVGSVVENVWGLTPTVAGVTYDGTGPLDSSVSFDGATTRLQYADNAVLNPDSLVDFGFMYWIQPDTTFQPGARIIRKRGGSPATGYEIYGNATADTRNSIYLSDGAAYLPNPVKAVWPDNGWNFNCWIVDRDYGFDIYLNNERETKEPFPGSPGNLTNTATINIGSAGSAGTWFGGNMSYVRMFKDSMLTDEEVNLHYTNESTFLTNGLFDIIENNDNWVVWDNGGGDGLWSTDANWSGDTKPVPTDSVRLDNTSDADLTVDENVRVGRLQVAEYYDGKISFGATVDTFDLGISLLGTDSVFWQTSTIQTSGSVTNSMVSVPGTGTLNMVGATAATLTHNGTGNLPDIVCNKSANGVTLGADAAALSFEVDAGDFDHGGFDLTADGDLLFDGSGTMTHDGMLKTTGASATAHWGSTLGTVTAPECSLVMATATAGVLDPDKSFTIKSLTINDNAVVTYSGAATIGLDGAGTMPLLMLKPGATFTQNRQLSMYPNAKGNLYQFGAGATWDGNAQIYVGFEVLADADTVFLPAVTTGGTVFWSLLYSTREPHYALSGDFVSAGDVHIYSAVAIAGAFFASMGYDMTIGGNFLYGGQGAGTMNYCWCTGSTIDVAGNVNEGSTYNGVNTTDYDSAHWYVGGNYTKPTNHVYNPAPTCTLELDGTGAQTVTMNGDTGGVLIVSNATGPASTASRAAFLSMDVQGPLDISGDTVTSLGDVSGTGSHDFGYDATSLLRISDGGKITGFDDDTLPKTEFLGGGGF